MLQDWPNNQKVVIERGFSHDDIPTLPTNMFKTFVDVKVSLTGFLLTCSSVKDSVCNNQISNQSESCKD